MTPDEIEAHCLALPAATLSVQWGGTHVFKVGGRIFAVTGGVFAGLAFKASDMAFELLPEQGLARPAPYLYRARWLQVSEPQRFEPDVIRAYLSQAHALVVARLTRKARAELGLC